MNEIDFVILWVDNTDPQWQTECMKYMGEDINNMNTNDCRYRDWGILKYWFRSVERYAPWVRKIHFVTYGHYPNWLNLEHTKLHLVRHEDFIPHEYLPTFSSHPIELNLHRINDLADKFVYFNDDMYVVAPVKQTDFFKEELPKDVAIRNFPLLYDIGHINMNCIDIINQEFYFMRQFKANLSKWMNYKYGFRCLQNLVFLPYGDFTGAVNTHVANAYNKTTFNEVWEKYGKELNDTCLHRFRSKQDINQWVFKYWQLVSGHFSPQRLSFGKYFLIDDVKGIREILKQNKTKLICINDNGSISDIRQLKKQVAEVFQEVFPMKCSYER